ncbi:Six-hairpin glycosidase [Aspergillus ellipticus CBS 707.79]|uniref:Six-hairpin glycosidase n=1 Tax=Aspergillus ellipticus CBS 707.79 TaxID=1448320 RepID=A0A319D405_9EURO|nr:Six-hairpin glycosidase [Aspergillus ellipticus CBS 707.79]
MTADWTLQAPWVWLPAYHEADNRPARFFLFRQTFTYSSSSSSSSSPNPVPVHVSADSRYRLFVNGHRVSFGPCKSYPGKWYYETVDIRPYLIEGGNVISARVLRYSTLTAGSSSIVSMPLPGFMLFTPVPDLPIRTDPTWRCCEETSAQIVPQAEWNYLLGPPFLSNNERSQEAPALAGWHRPGYDDSAWSAAVWQSPAVKMLPMVSPWTLHPRPIPALPEIPRRFDGVTHTTGCVTADQWRALIRADQPVVVPAGERVRVDLGVDSLTTAFVEVPFRGGAGATVSILYAECYEKDLGVDTSPFPMPRRKADRADSTGRLYGPKDFYTGTAGQSTHTFAPFWFRCFRYMQLEIVTASQALTLDPIALRETAYPLDITTVVRVGPELTPIWDISLRTLHLCRHETFEDCPFYEQNQFAADSRLQMLFGYQLARDDRLARKTLEEFHASRTPAGLIVAQYPRGFPSKQIPQFSLFWVLMVHDHMRYWADRAVVRRYLGTVDGILHHFAARLDARGLVGRFDADSWPFVDWVPAWAVPGQIFQSCMPPAYHATGAATVNSLLYAYTLRQAAALCDFVGRTSTADEYRAHVSRIRAAVNARCRDDSDSVFFYQDGPGVAEYSQHTQVFAILSETVTGEAAQQLLRRTLRTPGLAVCSYAMRFYVFRAAEKAGLYAELFDSLLDPWRAMRALNLTTWAEDDMNARRDCHGWSASPVHEIVTQLFGVSPAEPGFERVRIAPRRALLEEAEGTLFTPRGDLRIGWQKGRALTIEATRDMRAEVILGGVQQQVVLVAGQPVIFEESQTQSQDGNRNTTAAVPEAGKKSWLNWLWWW